MTLKFDELRWHDSILKSIYIDREKDDDTIQLVIQWSDEEEKLDKIEFYDCYGFNSCMHFGVFPPDYILEASCISQSNEIEKIKSAWARIDVDLKNLLQFQIKTNSTNSVIDIFCLGFRICPLD